MDKAKAINKAAALCSGSEQCSADIREKLARWGVGDEDAADIMTRLTDEGFIDDTRYARAFAHDRIRYHRWGRVKIAYMLRMKRIGSAAIDEALSAIDDEWADEYHEALLATLAARPGDSAKAMRYAASHGFTSGEIQYCPKRFS